ncbi:unnamed protein product [Gordionus sp. m RMFG-2023]|uniref:uncharacterized protein LOC135923043 n=1 Tax=Gordionus sp. m RMFG-2023 TaxID=3053472 RepID=UPI0030DDEBC5
MAECKKSAESWILLSILTYSAIFTHFFQNVVTESTEIGHKNEANLTTIIYLHPTLLVPKAFLTSGKSDSGAEIRKTTLDHSIKDSLDFELTRSKSPTILTPSDLGSGLEMDMSNVSESHSGDATHNLTAKYGSGNLTSDLNSVPSRWNWLSTTGSSKGVDTTSYKQAHEAALNVTMKRITLSSYSSTNRAEDGASILCKSNCSSNDANKTVLLPAKILTIPRKYSNLTAHRDSVPASSTSGSGLDSFITNVNEMADSATTKEQKLFTNISALAHEIFGATQGMVTVLFSNLSLEQWQKVLKVSLENFLITYLWTHYSDVIAQSEQPPRMTTSTAAHNHSISEEEAIEAHNRKPTFLAKRLKRLSGNGDSTLEIVYAEEPSPQENETLLTTFYVAIRHRVGPKNVTDQPRLDVRYLLWALKSFERTTLNQNNMSHSKMLYFAVNPFLSRIIADKISELLDRSSYPFKTVSPKMIDCKPGIKIGRESGTDKCEPGSICKTDVNGSAEKVNGIGSGESVLMGAVFAFCALAITGLFAYFGFSRFRRSRRGNFRLPGHDSFNRLTANRRQSMRLNKMDKDKGFNDLMDRAEEGHQGKMNSLFYRKPNVFGLNKDKNMDASRGLEELKRLHPLPERLEDKGEAVGDDEIRITKSARISSFVDNSRNDDLTRSRV